MCVSLTSCWMLQQARCLLFVNLILPHVIHEPQVIDNIRAISPSVMLEHVADKLMASSVHFYTKILQWDCSMSVQLEITKMLPV